MIDLLKAFTIGLFSLPETPEELTLWRLKLVTGITVLIGAVTLHQLNAYGFIGEGFARALDVKDVQAELVAREIDRVDTALCMQAGDQQLLNYLRSLENDYRSASGREYSHKTCDLLLSLKE